MLEALIGLVTLVLGMLGGIITRDRQIMRMIHDGDQKSADDLKVAENKIHERINATITDTNKMFDNMRESAQDHFVGTKHFESCISGVKTQLKSIDDKLNTLLDKHLK